MKTWASIFALLVLVSCGSALKMDPSIPAIEAGYPTLEFEACGKLWHGLGVCSLNTGHEYNSVGLKVQGYYRGTGRAVSTNCEIDKTFSYSDNQKFEIPIPGTVSNNCIISITLSPEYPDENDSGLRISSLRGHLVIQETHGEGWFGDVRKVTGDWKSTLRIPVGPGGPVRVVIRGCEVRYDRDHALEDGVLVLELSEAVKRASKGLCVLEGVIIDPRYEDFLFTVVMAQYATQLPEDPVWKDFRFGPLAMPQARLAGSKLVVEGSSDVSVLSLDQEFVLKGKKTFKFDPTKYHIVRSITVKGRSVLGEWDPAKKEFKWMQ